MTYWAPLRAGTPKLSAAGPDRNVTIPSLNVSCADAAAARTSEVAATADKSATERRTSEKRSMILSPGWPAAGPPACSSRCSGVGGCWREFRRAFPARLPMPGSEAVLQRRHLAIDDRHRPCPARRSALDLDRKARHGETGRRQKLQIVQLFDMAVADVASGLVALPDQAGIPGLGELFRGVDERRIPAPAVDAGQPHAALEQIHRRFVAHAAAGIDIILLAVFGPGAGIDHDDFERRKRVANALELVFDIPGRRHIAVRQMAKVQLHPGLQAPLQRHLVDGP